ncbi:MAG: LTA synthase family protein [Succinivibrio sp.]
MKHLNLIIRCICSFIISVKKISSLISVLFILTLALCSTLLVNIPKQFASQVLADSIISVKFSAYTAIDEFEYVEIYADRKKIYDKILFFSKSPTSHLLTFPINENFEKLSFTLSGLSPTISVSDLEIGNVRVTDGQDLKIYSNDPLCKISSLNDNSFTLEKKDPSSTEFSFSVDKKSIADNLFLVKIDDPYYKRLFYYICALCQKHPQTLLMVLLALLLLVNICYSRRSFTVITNITIAYFIVMINMLWLDAEDVLKTFFTGDRFEVFYKILKTQFLPLSVLLSMSFVLSFLKNRLSKLFAVSLSILLLIILTVDIFAYTEFKVHLVVSDIFSYTKDVGDSGKIISDFIFNKKQVFLTLMLLVISIVYSYIYFYKSKKARWTGAVMLFTLFSCIYFLPSASSAGNEAVFSNVFTSGNASKNANLGYSGSYDEYHEPVIEIKGLNQKKNVILLVVESLSSYQSAFFNGIKNNTPNIDRLAQEGITFTNYNSNGFHTDTGNFAILSSLPSINGSLRSITDPKFLKDSFVHKFVSEGYSTYCVYSANDVGLQNRIKKVAGINKAYTGKESFYKNSERLSFDSVPDQDMFDMIMTLLPKWQEHGPFLTHIMTTTTHGPYIVPKTHELSYEKTINYADDAIYKFYNDLKKAHFFDNGMLVITSDHRAMLSFSSVEQSRYGRAGISKIPLIIIGSGIENRIYKEQASHNSLGAILEYLNLEKSSFYQFNAIPFLFRDDKEKQVNGFTIFQYHEPQDNLLVIDHEGKDYKIQLDGDNTRFIDSCKNEEFKEHVLNTIRWIRTM